MSCSSGWASSKCIGIRLGIKKMKQFKAVSDLLRIRNIGVVAHIDAGKTTLTERMLYYCGAVAKPGNVDDGNTITDYLSQERERGITIRAAAISFKWQDHQVNLVDTPGHIDFNGEVERSLRVMDGGIVVVDSSKGVETQTETVWRQCEKFQVPRIIFCNKLDTGGAMLEIALNSIKVTFTQRRLKASPLAMHYPLGLESQYRGHIDLVNLLAFEYCSVLGDKVDITPVGKLDTSIRTKALEAREELLDQVATLDDDFAVRARQNKYLNGEFTTNELVQAIRRLVRNMTAFPVFCGSALKNRGVQALLDGVIDYLPSPSEAKQPLAKEASGSTRSVSTTDKELRALAFKYIYDQGRQPLTYVRVYSGKLKQGQSLFNTTQSLTEKPSRIYRVQAGQYIELNEVGPGDIAALAGLRMARSGDTLVNRNENCKEVLPGLEMPPPVFFCSIAPVHEGEQEKLEEILIHLVKEDPSLMCRTDEENSSLLVTGQGELHLEILRDRLLEEFKLKVALGSMQVAYRESVRNAVKLTYRLDRSDAFLELTLKLKLKESQLVLNSVSQVLGSEHFKSLHASARFSLVDLKDTAYSALVERAAKEKALRAEKRLDGITLGKTAVELEAEALEPLHKLPQSLRSEIEAELTEALTRGSLLGYPVIEVEVNVVDGLFDKRTSHAAIRECVAKSIQELLHKGDPYLLEPQMKIVIRIPDGVLGDVLSDLSSSRRGEVVEVQKESGFSTVLAVAPLSELVGYSSVLRSLSRGAAEFSMEYTSYAFVGEEAQHNLLGR